MRNSIELRLILIYLQMKKRSNGATRGIGLSRKKSSQKLTSKTDSKFQCKLSMFGFEKRPQMN